ncbi:hypothetical protein ACFFLM_04440 [Deinococcus oregonensis]|uniref:Uncharacterized protein n=1 Tax=Deinococcus oregonensis TaxID=1805970 RepID=A0ABV6AUP8_9DEIO
MTTQTFGLGVRFTADENSLERLALGGTVKWSAFTDAAFGTAGQRVIPAGTVVKRDVDKQLIPVPGNTSDAAGTAFLTASDIVENPAIKRGSDKTTGLYAGGVYYDDRLPQTLTAGQKTALGPKFTFQKAQGALVITE